MKSIPYLAALALFILSSCSSAYKTTQTPDDVYYSPRVKPTYAASNNQNNDNVTATDADGDGGTYVTYDDEDQGDYSRRINMFNGNSKGSYYDYYSPNVYSGYGSPYYGSPYYGSGWGISSYYGYGGGLGYGWGSPYYSSFWGPSISIGFGYGWGYNPWYSPWYSSWSYNPWYYGGYYGGYYPGYYGGHGGYYGYSSVGRRTRGSFGTSYPGRVVGNSTPNPGGRTGRTDYIPSRRGSGTTDPGGRVVERPTTGGRTNPDGYYTPRRSFTPSSGERPVGSDGGGRTSGSYNPPTRSFQPAQQPQRSYTPAPSYTPRSSGSGGGGRAGRSRN
jgi:hypothetical protein